MRPANQQQAIKQLLHLFDEKKILLDPDGRSEAEQIAETIFRRFQVGPYQYQVKHIRWFLQNSIKTLSPQMQYHTWLIIKKIIAALGKDSHWLGQLRGPWLTSD